MKQQWDWVTSSRNISYDPSPTVQTYIIAYTCPAFKKISLNVIYFQCLTDFFYFVINACRINPTISSPNENFEYSYSYSNAVLRVYRIKSLFGLKSERWKPHNTSCHPTK